MNPDAPDAFTRRELLIAATAAAAGTMPLAGCASSPPPGLEVRPPIVFVHGNGDTAAVWTTTIWRFETNGWPRERLSAIDLPYPTARNEDDKAQPGRSSIADFTAALAAEVKRVQAATGAPKVVLVGLSRGGYAIRNFIADGGAGQVSHAILGGVPNHGVWANRVFLPGSEFNGQGPLLTRLNAPQGPEGHEVTPGVKWLTLRSDNNDKYAQPEGTWIGQRGVATNVTFDGPALKGAQNVVIAGIDHRETALGAKAFAEMWRFLTGKPPETLDIAREAKVVLDGRLTGLGLDNRDGSFASNLPLVGATLEVYATHAASGERLGPALYTRTIGADGRWGPFTTGPEVRHEFVISAPGYAITHVYRSPFPRSSQVVNLRAERLAEADRGAGAVVEMRRPRGYFGVPRDHIVLDGTSPPAGIPQGVAGVSEARLRLAEATSRPIAGEFNEERVVGRVWPAAGNHITLLELTS